MDIRSLSLLLVRQRCPVFSVGDAALLSPRGGAGLLRLQLHQWARKGWLVRLKRGLYELAYPEPSVVPDFLVANRLYEPSYVSLETALSHYQLLPETAPQVTSVTPKATRRFRNAHGLFTYFTVRPRAFAGYTASSIQGFPVRLAEPEKAVMDFLYACLRRGRPLRFEEDRWDRGGLRKMKRSRLESYAGLFADARAARKLKGWIDALLR